MEKGLQAYDSFCKKIWMILPLSFVVGSGVAYGKFRLFHLIGLLYVVPILLRIKIIRPLKWEIPFLLFVAWEFISILWAPDKDLSLRYLFCLANGLFLIFSIKCFLDNSENNLQKFLKVLFYFNLLMIGFGFFETLGLLRWPFSFYSPSYYGNNIEELMQIYKTGLEGLWFVKTQPAIFFWNTNDLCFYLVTTLPFVFITKIGKEWLKYIYIFLLYWILFASAGRASLFGGILVLIAMLFPIFKQSKEMKRFLFALFLLATFVVLSVQKLTFLGIYRQSKIIAFSNSVISYSEGKAAPTSFTKFYNDSSTVKRSELLKRSYSVFKTRPLTGIGAGNLLLTFNNLTPINIHNFWIEILVEGGVIGASLFLFWIIVWLSKIKLLKSESYVFYLSFFVMIPSALAVSSAIYQPGFWIPLVVLFLAGCVVRELGD